MRIILFSSLFSLVICLSAATSQADQPFVRAEVSGDQGVQCQNVNDEVREFRQRLTWIRQLFAQGSANARTELNSAGDTLYEISVCLGGKNPSGALLQELGEIRNQN